VLGRAVFFMVRDTHVSRAAGSLCPLAPNRLWALQGWFEDDELTIFRYELDPVIALISAPHYFNQYDDSADSPPYPSETSGVYGVALSEGSLWVLDSNQYMIFNSFLGYVATNDSASFDAIDQEFWAKKARNKIEAAKRKEK